MRSRAARLTASAMACIALGVAGYFLFITEQQISGRRQSLRTFDQHAREAASALADARSAQQAYVAAGQGVASWLPKVTVLQEEMTEGVDRLRAAALSTEARASLMAAAASLTEFGNVDRRARDYLRSGQTLMAGDVVFSEGGETATAAARLIESARLAEQQAFDAAEADVRRRETIAIGGAAAVSLFVMGLLSLAPPGGRSRHEASTPRSSAATVTRPAADLMMRDLTPKTATAQALPRDPAPLAPPVPLLKAAAELCTEFGRVHDTEALPGLLARAAQIMDASGVVVWLGNAAGADLRPVIAHGYPDNVLARMPNVPRSADNATATAYRTGKLQIVLRRPGGSNGAVVAPLLAAEGCVGALTAEIQAGSETTEGVQAVAALIAAQLTGVLSGSGSTAAAPSDAAGDRIALA